VTAPRLAGAGTLRGGLSGSGLRHFLEHQLRRYRTTWRGTVVSGVANPVVFLLALGVGLGSLIDQEGRGDLGAAATYLEFVGPGLLAAAAMQAGTAESLWPTLGALKWEGTYKAVLATPLSAAELATGHILWIGFRVAVGATLYTLVLTAFGIPRSPWTVLAVPAAVLTALAFAAPFSAFSARQETDETFPMINRVLIVPLFLFSGAFFPIEQLPAALEVAARLTPLWHGVTLCRDLMLGSATLAGAVGHLAFLLLFVIAGWWWAVRTFSARLTS
jgi:lipooligosaccharide transport system permease protein